MRRRVVKFALLTVVLVVLAACGQIGQPTPTQEVWTPAPVATLPEVFMPTEVPPKATLPPTWTVTPPPTVTPSAPFPCTVVSIGFGRIADQMVDTLFATTSDGRVFHTPQPLGDTNIWSLLSAKTQKMITRFPQYSTSSTVSTVGRTTVYLEDGQLIVADGRLPISRPC